MKNLLLQYTYIFTLDELLYFYKIASLMRSIDLIKCNIVTVTGFPENRFLSRVRILVKAVRTYLISHLDSTMKPSELREYSLITWGLERVFRILQLLSISTWAFGTRAGTHAQFTSEAQKAATTKIRSRRIEAYVGAWFLVEAVIVVVHPSYPILWTACAWIGAYRLIDIFQASMNVTLFDRLRLQDGRHYVAAIARTVVLSLWNFIEAIVCFGIIYATNCGMLKNATDQFDPYYFSAVTQLTIGYGDLLPTDWLRAVAMAQGVFGFVLAVFAISRVVAFLPKASSVLGDETDG